MWCARTIQLTARLDATGAFSLSIVLTGAPDIWNDVAWYDVAWND